jgi:GNAT superfamily N-acetyltransferase
MSGDFTLKDGGSVHVRAIRPDDDRTLIDIFNQSSPETIYQRFFTPLTELSPALARHLSHVDYRRRMALIAQAGARPIGVARYEPTANPHEVELAIAIVDEWQNRGLGRILLRQILAAAEANGIPRFRAGFLGENRRVLHLLLTECRIQEWASSAGITSVVGRSHSSISRPITGHFAQ